MKILAIGDIVGNKSVDYIADRLFRVRQELEVDMVVANGENAADIHGISAKNATDILAAGVDVITLGNHSFARKDIFEILGGDYNVIRPANYPSLVPGIGHITVEVSGYRILCMNVMGTALMEPMACPFETVENILGEEKGKYDFSLLDIHAEATSEKIALARYFDGRINIIFGTHTHVATADEQILPRGTGYITDLGMSGPVNGVLGTDATVVIERMRTKIPARFVIADGEIKANGALFELDTASGRVKSVRRVRF